MKQSSNSTRSSDLIRGPISQKMDLRIKSEGLILFLLAFLLTIPAHANTLVAKVDGMVCAFCAKGVEDKLRENPAVDKVTISLDDKTVTVTAKPNQTLDKKVLEKAVYYIGLTLKSIDETK